MEYLSGIMVKLERECGSRCRSRAHAGQLVAAVTKGNLRQLQIFLLTCSNPTGITDEYHRSGKQLSFNHTWKIIVGKIRSKGLEPPITDRK